ncbi:MAG: hypothetical protein GF421_06835 [Candidatus Aminicenantes bacterium]|nr:hypothetical protein [Candidatus Aminicenantes bacterium]
MKSNHCIRFLMIWMVLFVCISDQKGLSQSEQDVYQKPVSQKREHSTLFGFTLGNTRPASERFKEVYGNIGVMTGIEISHFFPLIQNSSLGISLEIRGMAKAGQSTISRQNTLLSMNPITVTGRYILKKGVLRPFLGTGLDIFLYKEQSSLGDHSGAAGGFHLEGGVYCHPPLFDMISIKAGVRWTRAVAQEDSIKVNLGGLEFGLGILLCFEIKKN